MNSRKKRFVNPIEIEVIKSARMETILGKSPAICNGHQPPRADYPYISKKYVDHISVIFNKYLKDISDFHPAYLGQLSGLFKTYIRVFLDMIPAYFWLIPALAQIPKFLLTIDY